MTKVAGLIPARYASSRLPGKVLAPILGKSMIQRVYERALQAELLDVVLIGTDDERVAEAVRAFGGRVVMTSPDHTSGTDRLAEMVQQPDSGVADAEIVVNIQGDQPFMDPLMIEEAVRPMLEDPELPMATLKHRVTKPEDLEDPAVVKVVVDHQDNALYFSRSRIPNPCKDVPHPVFEHVGLYVYRRDFLVQSEPRSSRRSSSRWSRSSSCGCWSTGTGYGSSRPAPRTTSSVGSASTRRRTWRGRSRSCGSAGWTEVGGEGAR